MQYTRRGKKNQKFQSAESQNPIRPAKFAGLEISGFVNGCKSTILRKIICKSLTQASLWLASRKSLIIKDIKFKCFAGLLSPLQAVDSHDVTKAKMGLHSHHNFEFCKSLNDMLLCIIFFGDRRNFDIKSFQNTVFWSTVYAKT